jgi:diguanylate cyclase
MDSVAMGVEQSRGVAVAWWSSSRWTRGADRRLAGRNHIIQAALYAVIASFVVTTVAGVRAHLDSLWIDGVLQSLGYGAAAVLCLVRTPPSSCDRVAWRFVAAGVLSFGLANVDRHMLLARTLDPFPIATLCHLLTGIYYACIFIALVHLMQSRVGRLPVSLVLGGAATWRRCWWRPCWV